MDHYPEPDSHVWDKVKVVLDLTNYASKKYLGHATNVDTSDLAAKKGINKLTNVWTSLINLKTKVDDFKMKLLKTQNWKQ